ncbi:DUF3789 domain-containing protein [Bacillus sp. OK048]|nr:DUF3789 domain-containing protein [Bacillus sp. OK048]SDM90493.1 Protein of unknown function [Bacillus sp. OK048]
MLTFIAGVVTGSFSMLFIMSLMSIGKNADHHMEMSLQKEHQ